MNPLDSAFLWASVSARSSSLARVSACDGQKTLAPGEGSVLSHALIV
jgi:hypothetical protein